MGIEPVLSHTATVAEPVLQVYLLGSVDFEAAIALQRRLVFDVAGNRNTSALILCEHPAFVTIGREGSWGHIQAEPRESSWQKWPIRWVNRGGGCLLHLPGQLAIYPILALDRLGLSLQAYLDRLHEVVISVLANFHIRGETRPGLSGVWVGSRPLAAVGVAVRDWITYYGAALNINPDLHLLRSVRWGASAKDPGQPMTSLERERHGPLRPALVRELLLEHFASRFSFARTSLFFDHPSLRQRARYDALTTSHG